MPTIDDLHAVFADLEDRAPLPDHGALQLDVRRGRRVHRAGVLLSAAAVAALAVAVTVAVSRPSGSASSHVAPGGSHSASSSTATSDAGSAKAAREAAASAQARAERAARAAERAHASAGSQTARIPFSLNLGEQARITDYAFDKANGGATVTTGGVHWDFGWSMSEIPRGSKPNVEKIDFNAHEWFVQRDRVSGSIMAVWVTAPGFGMTIVPVGKDLTLSQYEAFLAHVSFPKNLADPSTWPEVRAARK